MPRRQAELLSRLLLACVGFAVAGCDRGTTVEGVITLDGQPLDGVHVVFIPLMPGPELYSVTDETGRYEMQLDAGEGPPAGSYRVRLATVDHFPLLDDEAEVEQVPPAYHSVVQLPVNLEPGFNGIDFELTSEWVSKKPKRPR